MRDRVFASARDAVSPPSEHVFYMNSVITARTLCYGVLMLTLPIYLLVGALCIMGGNVSALLPLLVVLGCGLLFEIIFAILLSWFYPVRITDNGITATDFWGRKLTLSWGEIETSTATRFMTLPYLKVASFRKDRAVLWLPMFVSRPDGLYQAIRHAASSGNPLRRYIEDETAPEKRERLPQ